MMENSCFKFKKYHHFAILNGLNLSQTNCLWSSQLIFDNSSWFSINASQNGFPNIRFAYFLCLIMCKINGWNFFGKIGID